MRKLLFYLFVLCLPVFAQRPSESTLREWQDRKFGLFIHFGLFSELGGIWKGQPFSGNYSEQIQSDAHIPKAEYEALASSFNPVHWDPDAVVQLAVDAGMKFIVLTAKHHEGFSMFGTKQSGYNIVDGTPYKRDVVRGLAEACHKRGMPFGVYYSTIDWHYGDVPSERNDNGLSKAHEDFNVAQLRELLTGYGPISEIWFDMGHPTPPQSRRFADTVHSIQPECLISGRVWNSEGDFSETGDDDIPDYLSDEPWESPASIFAETWGYRSWQHRVPLEDKVHEHILRLVKVASRGGNYILNIGPKGDGSVIDYEADVLKGVGSWLQQNGQAIYGVAPQPFRKLDFGYATVRGNQLYLFVEQMPPDGVLRLPGLQNQIKEAHWLGSAQALRVSNQSVNMALRAKSGFLPVAVATFQGSLKVFQPAVQPRTGDAIYLLPEAADKFYNDNGEGYWDVHTLRREEWHFSVKRAGRYSITLGYKAGTFSRLLDVQINGQTLKANLYGEDHGPALAGAIELPQAEDLTLSISPAAPRERGAKIDVEISQILLSLQ